MSLSKSSASQSKWIPLPIPLRSYGESEHTVSLADGLGGDVTAGKGMYLGHGEGTTRLGIYTLSILSRQTYILSRQLYLNLEHPLSDFILQPLNPSEPDSRAQFHHISIDISALARIRHQQQYFNQGHNPTTHYSMAANWNPNPENGNLPCSMGYLFPRTQASGWCELAFVP